MYVDIVISNIFNLNKHFSSFLKLTNILHLIFILSISLLLILALPIIYPCVYLTF